MANPSNFQITPCVALAENNEINFRSLYLKHTRPKPALGTTAVINWKVYDGLWPEDKVVARAQGLQIYAGSNWHNTFSLVFEVERFKGSTLQVMGISAEQGEEGEWAIVGGTGEFARATGVISKKLHEKKRDGNIIKLAIHASCPLPKVTKIGPWGGKRGTNQDITVAPRRLESITVCKISGEVVNSIVFSYIDRTGQKRTSDRLGGSGGEPYTIKLASNEFVKEVSGTFGKYKQWNSTVILSLKFVTTVKTYGRFGDKSGKGTRFSVPVRDRRVIVGFFGRGGKYYLNAVGVYVHPF